MFEDEYLSYVLRFTGSHLLSADKLVTDGQDQVLKNVCGASIHWHQGHKKEQFKTGNISNPPDYKDFI